MKLSRKYYLTVAQSVFTIGLITVETGFALAKTDNTQRLIDQLNAVKERTINETIIDAQIQKKLQTDAFTHFPAIQRSNFLRGSSDEISWTLNLTKEDAQQGGEFVVNFRNSATVLPGASNIELFVNDKQVAKAEASAALNPSFIKGVIQGNDILVPGKNTFSVRAKQVHRVDCSFAATNELWTEIIPENTVFRFADKNRRISRLSDLQAFPVSPGQTSRLNIVMKDWSSDRATAYLESVQLLAANLNMKNLSVNIFNSNDAKQNEAPQLDFFSGTANQLLANKDLQALYQDVDFEELLLSDAKKPVLLSSSKHLRHLLVHIKDSTPTNDFNKLFATNEKQAIDKAFEINKPDGATFTLDEAGFDLFTKTGSVDYSSKIVFPADFFPADYDSISISLEGKADLGDREQINLVLHVNGKTQGSISITENQIENGALKDVVAEIPLLNFAPGLNEIRLTAELNSTKDDACTSDFKDGFAKLDISGASKISVPQLALFTPVTNINTTLETGYTYNEPAMNEDLLLISEKDDFKSLALAATYLGQIASRTGKRINITHTDTLTSLEALNTANRLVVTRNQNSKLFDSKKLHTISDAKLNQFWNSENQSTSSSSEPKEPIKREKGNLGKLKDQVNTIANGDNRALAELASQLKDSYRYVANRPVFSNKQAENSRTRLEEAKLIISQNRTEENLTTLILHSDRLPDEPLSFALQKPRDVSPTDPIITASVNSQSNSIYLDNQPLLTPTFESIERSRLLDFNYLKNIRLLIAGVLSNNPIVYGITFILALFLSGFFYSRLMNNTARRHGDDYERDV